jgi:mono/diheme cytochrome c family protein
MHTEARAYIYVCIGLVMSITGCGKPDPNKRFVYPEEVKDFTALFELNCQGCHGPDGRRGPAPPLNDALFLAIVPDAELQRVIAEGRKGTLMPAFAQEKGGTLTAEQVDILVKDIRAHWGKQSPASGTKPPPYLLADAVKNGLSKKGDAGDGAMVFDMACAYCHGEKGKGGKETVGAVNDPSFLALMSDQVLRRIVITGRSDFGMPDYVSEGGRDPKFKPLTAQDVADVTALMISWKQAGAKARK